MLKKKKSLNKLVKEEVIASLIFLQIERYEILIKNEKINRKNREADFSIWEK